MFKSVIVKFCWIGFIVGSSLLTADEIDLSRPDSWLQAKALSTDGTSLRIKGSRQLHSRTVFRAEPGKTYRLLGSFKMVPGTASAPIHYGILPLDGRKQPLYAVNVKSKTVLAADAKAGDRELQIADGRNWAAAKNIQIVLNPETPEEKILPAFPLKLEKAAPGKVVLSQPLTESLAGGTPVAIRQLVPPLYFAVERSSEKGLTDPPTTSKETWHPGIKYFRVLILANWKPTPKDQPVPELEMRDLKLQIQ